MSADIGHLPIPQFHRTPSAAIGTAAQLADRQKFVNILVVGQTAEADLIFLSAGNGEQMTSAEALWVLEMAKLLLLNRDDYRRL